MTILALTPVLASFYSEQTIDSRHFGANLIFDRDRFETTANGPSGTYGTALEMLGVNTIRYPGGTVTELVFDLANPNANQPTFELVDVYRIFDPDRKGPLQASLLGLDEVLQYAGQASLSMSFVMPSLRFLGTNADSAGNRQAEVEVALVRNFTMNFLSQALASDVPIQAIELGNEWWVDNANLLGGTRMSAVEYGRIASTLASIIQEAIDDFRESLPFGTVWSEPDIVVQVGPGGSAEMVMQNGHRPLPGFTGELYRATEIIFNQFDELVEQTAIDGLLTHRYQTNESHNINGWAYKPFETWKHLASQDSDFGALDYYVTEWNVAARNADYAGLLQASAIISLFSEMVMAGVDHANVWAIQQNNDTRLTDNIGWNGDTTVNLSLAGEVFRMLNDSVHGMRVIPLIQSNATFSTRAFGNEESIVLYISNLSGQANAIDFDISSLAERVVDVDGTALHLLGNNPLDNDALPVVSVIGSLVFTRPSEVSFMLGAYQTAEIEITLGNVTIQASGIGIAERVLGSQNGDNLDGFGENDTIYGFGGRDTLYGGSGDDRLFGGAGADLLFGGTGSDKLLGGEGNDRLSGESPDANFDPVAAQVYRIYRATLDRAPDPGGLMGWTGQLLSGMSSDQAVAGFFSSREFQIGYGATSDNQFVTLLYTNVLDRAPDAGGLAAWTGALAGGTSRERVVQGFSESAEFNTRTEGGAMGVSRAALQGDWADDVFRLYQATLDRAPDPGGLAAWSSALAQGRPYLDAVAGFVASAEFQARYGATTNAQFVTQLYANVLDRAPDPGGFATWTGALTGGMSRSQVVQGFAQSREFRAATQDDILAWMRARPDDRIEGGAGRNVLLGGIGADTFVFDRADAGNHVVADLERWDILDFEGFGYANAAEVLARMTQTEAGVVFADQGTRFLLADAMLGQLGADMLLF